MGIAALLTVAALGSGTADATTAPRAVGLLRPYGFIILYGLLLTGFLSRIVGPVQQMIFRWLL